MTLVTFINSHTGETYGTVQSRALTSVLRERKRQDEKWGVQDHDAFTWMAILSEEVGEAAQEALTERYGASGNGHGNIREEVVHIAAVALAWIENIDRRTDS